MKVRPPRSTRPAGVRRLQRYISPQVSDALTAGQPTDITKRQRLEGSPEPAPDRRGEELKGRSLGHRAASLALTERRHSARIYASTKLYLPNE